MKAQQHHNWRPGLTAGRSHNVLIRFTLLLTILAMLLPAVSSFSAEEDSMEVPGKMIFLPFTVQTSKPQQYLQDGLTDMLATRMTNRTGLVAIHRSSETRQLAALIESGDQQAFKSMLNALDADYLVIGSLEQQDTEYEIMIYVFNRNRPTPSSFTRTIPALNRAIAAMDEISMEIAGQVFNKDLPEQLVSTTTEDAGASGFQTAHPDRAYKEGLYQPAAILGIDGDEIKVLSSRRSNKIKAAVRTMAAGDLDGDTTGEIVLVEKGNMAIYRFASDHFQHVADHPIPSYLAPQTVSLADLNNNGRLEIYLAANNGDSPSSWVFEWDGSEFHTLHKEVPFYLRPGRNKKGKEVLIGQKGSNLGPAGRSFYEMTETADGILDKTAKIMVPKGFNLFDFIRADLDLDGTMEFIGITTKNKLVVLDPAGKPLWKSEIVYGASKHFLGTLTSNRAGGRTPTYMHTRLIAKDLDGDDKPEIIIGRNRLTTVKYMKKLRYFEGSSISALNWDGSDMTTTWETRKIPGYTTDYQVAMDTGETNTFRLFFIESDSSYPLFFWEADSSVIHLYEMGRKQSTGN